MTLNNNPFNVLNATPRDSTQRLKELCDEYSLNGNADEIEAAYAALTDPSARLAAEIRWIDAGSLGKGAGLLNALLQNMETSEFGIDAVIRIAKAFDELTPHSVSVEINESRLAAGFPQVENLAAVGEELKNLRADIRNIIISRLGKFGIEELAEVVTTIVENCETSYYAVIDDIIDYYKTQKRSALDEQAAATEERARYLNDQFELAKKLNRENTAYYVGIGQTSVSIPRFCTCCMAETHHTENICYSVSEKHGFTEHTKTVSLDFPLCDDCVAHRREVKEKKWLLNIISMLSGIAITILTAIGGVLVNLFFMPIIGTIAVYVFAGLLLKTRELSDLHSNKINSVWFSDISLHHSGVIMNFTNMFYARLFAESNRALMQVKKYRKRVLREGVLQSVARPFANALFVCSIVTGALMVTLFAISETSSPRRTNSRPPSISLPYSIPSIPPMVDFEEPEVDYPPNGDYQNLTGDFEIAPLMIATPNDRRYHYVILKDELTGKAAFSLFIHPGETVEVDVPLGDYRMYYATGRVWYGATHLFGPNTQYYKADTVLSFRLEGFTAEGHSIELIGQVGGNLSTSTANADDFILDE